LIFRDAVDIDRTYRATEPFRASKPSGIAESRKCRCNVYAMSTKSRQVIWGGQIMGAKIRAQGARERAKQAIREADRAEAEAWSIRMEGYGGPALTVAHDRAMPERRSRLARSGMQSL
jgi:hypothetical protein